MTDRDPFIQVLSSLVAAVSLLERGGKKAAPSDRMFDQMLLDYKAAIAVGRAALAQQAEPVQKTHDDSWEETARQYAENAKYWREKYEAAGKQAEPLSMSMFATKADYDAALAQQAEPVKEQYEKECSDIDAILTHLGLDIEQCRTDGGWLNVPKIKTLLQQAQESHEQQAEPVACHHGSRMCIWEDCDLDAIYCEGHAKEAFAAPPADEARELLKEALKGLDEYWNPETIAAIKAYLAKR